MKAAQIGSFVNPKGRKVVLIEFSNGETLKYRPLQKNWRFRDTNGEVKWSVDAADFGLTQSVDMVGPISNIELDEVENDIILLAEVDDLGLDSWLDYDDAINVYSVVYDLIKKDN